MSKFYNSIVTKVAFPIIDYLGGTNFFKSYKLLKELEYSDREVIKNFQTERLREILRYAYQNVPYYKKLFDNIDNLNIDNVGIEDLHRIPKLSKDIIRSNFDDLKSNEFSKIKKKYHSTGGSTGNPMYFYQDFESYSFSWPANIRGWGFIDFELGDKFMTLGSSSLIKEKKSYAQKLLHLLFRDFTYGGIHLSKKVYIKLIKEIREKDIEYIYGYASTIYMFAKFIIDKNYQLDIKGVMPTSEICPDYYKETYRKAFNCKICDSYGARDGNISAFQCEKGNYHLSEYSVAIIEGGGSKGNVLVTDLFNKSMPMINYEVGDILTLTQEQCECGRGQFLAKEILGRVQSVIKLDNGVTLTGPGWTILFKDRNIIKYRIRQVDGRTIEADIVPGKEYDKKTEEKIIVKNFNKHIGEGVSFNINYVDDIDNSNSGKATYFISKTE